MKVSPWEQVGSQNQSKPLFCVKNHCGKMSEGLVNYIKSYHMETIILQTDVNNDRPITLFNVGPQNWGHFCLNVCSSIILLPG